MTQGEVVDITRRLERSAAPPARADSLGTLTVRLDPVELAAFAGWCQEAGVGPADGCVVLRHLVLRLVADPGLAADVRADLREGRTVEEISQFSKW